MSIAWSPKSTAALVRERDLEFRVRQLLTQQCGVHDPHVVLVEEEPDRLCVLYTVQTLEGRGARTAWITPDPAGGDPEVVTATGFLV